MNKKFVYYVFLDDERNTEDVFKLTNNDVYQKYHWLVVRTFNEFTSLIKKYFNKYKAMPSLLSLDHDLADFENGKEKTGYDVVKWLVDFCIDNELQLPETLVHSKNVVGKSNMESYLKNGKEHIKLLTLTLYKSKK